MSDNTEPKVPFNTTQEPEKVLLTPELPNNELRVILSVGVPYMNMDWAVHKNEQYHMLQGFYNTKGFKEAERATQALILAEVLDVIGGWHKYPSKAYPGDEQFIIAETINKRNAELREAAKERFK